MVSRTLIQKCLPIPTCKNTPRGGSSMAMMIRSKSINSLPVSIHLLPITHTPHEGCYPAKNRCQFFESYSTRISTLTLLDQDGERQGRDLMCRPRESATLGQNLEVEAALG